MLGCAEQALLTPGDAVTRYEIPVPGLPGAVFPPLCLGSRGGVHIAAWRGRQVGKTTELFLPLPRTGVAGRLEKG